MAAEPPRWRAVKQRTPVIGIDDGGFDRTAAKPVNVNLYGVIMKGAAYVDGIIQCQMQRDDPAVTTHLGAMITRSAHHPQLRAIFLQGLTTGGFGVIDIDQLYQSTNIPVIVVLRKDPDYPAIQAALLANFSDGAARWATIQRAGPPVLIQENPPVFIQCAGIHSADAALLTQICTAIGTIPEALRIAHFIGASRYRFWRDQLNKVE